MLLHVLLIAAVRIIGLTIQDTTFLATKVLDSTYALWLFILAQ